jgi:hypothetical protein
VPAGSFVLDRVASALIVVLILGACVQEPEQGSSPQGLSCLDFEDLTLGDTHHRGDSFASSGAQLEVRAFTFTGGGTPSVGFVEVEDGRQAGGSGLEMNVNNVLLVIDFGQSVNGLSLAFGEYGGNVNLEVNGDFANVEDFADVNGTTLGGASVTVRNGPEPSLGTLTLAGTVERLAVGGQELWIDDVCPGVGSSR